MSSYNSNWASLSGLDIKYLLFLYVPIQPNQTNDPGWKNKTITAI